MMELVVDAMRYATEAMEYPSANKRKSRTSKWRCGSERIHSVDELVDSLARYGGVWWIMPRDGKFMNAAWVWSQQLRYLRERICQGVFYYPERNWGV